LYWKGGWAAEEKCSNPSHSSLSCPEFGDLEKTGKEVWMGAHLKSEVDDWSKHGQGDGESEMETEEGLDGAG
jgi:hypothetical protein